ncbi:MAG TPA: chemotaxis protein CheW [Candidatus Limnocylindrales bacterium]|nr:chemotaxis protein CheW [Candidatus Limnocylindrales bacterium]
MSAPEEKSYVLFSLGMRRFALPAEAVTELARPDTLQAFPHRTPLLTGVLVRRGRIVPVCDVAQVLVGAGAPPRKYYLLAKCQLDSRQELLAVPVTGECELVSFKPVLNQGEKAPYISGLLDTGEEIVEIVDLEALLSMEAVP